MRKLLCLIACCLTLFVSYSQNNYIGIEVGNGLSNLRFTQNTNIDNKATHSYNFGILWGKKISKTRSFETGVFYSKQGQNFKDKYIVTQWSPAVPIEISLKYFKIPFISNYNFFTKNNSILTFSSGFVFSNLIYQRSIFRVPFGVNRNYYFGIQDISLIAGLQYENLISEKFSFKVGFLYEKGFINALNYKFFNDYPICPPQYTSGKNSTITLNMGINYFFNQPLLVEDKNKNLEKNKKRRNIISVKAGFGEFFPTVNSSSNDSYGQFVSLTYLPVHYERIFFINNYNKINLHAGLYGYTGISKFMNDNKKKRYLSRFKYPLAVEEYGSGGLKTGISLLSGLRNHFEIGIFTSSHQILYERWKSSSRKEVVSESRFLFKNIIIYSGYRYYNPEKTPFTFKVGVQYEYQKKHPQSSYSYNLALCLGLGLAF